MEGFGFSVRRSLLSRSSQFKPACSSCLLSLIQRNSSPSPAQSPPSHSSNSRVSPAFVFVILAVFVIFFTSCMLHIFVRFFAKLGSRSTASSGPFSGEFPGSDTFQRRLQQLFHLHDSGLDQATIDTLPVFLYEEIIGAKEPFDCAVCLSQFAEEDKLRLLPACSHAFHINCIDTWLLSNSTCPLCREPLVFFPEQSIDSRASDLEDDLTDVEISKGGAQLQWPKPVEMEERIFPVRLGKFRSCDNGDDRPSCDASTSNTSSSICRSLDSRRCFSLGSYRYEVSEDCRLRVALSGGENGDGGEEDAATGKKLGARSRGESFSVSKIWQWSGRKTEMAFTSQISQTQRAETGAQTNPSIFLT